MVKNIDYNKLIDLVKKYKEIVNSCANKRNKKFWLNQQPWYRENWRGIPTANFKKVPLIINPEKQMWSYILGINLTNYYSDPLEYLKQELKMGIYRFNNWNDNIYFDGSICVFFSGFMETSFFGPKLKFFKNRSPILNESSKSLLTDKKYLSKMKIPDFYKSGLMPLIHKYYEVIKGILGGELEVLFPNWTRGPFGIAMDLRGMENMLVDMVTDKVFVHNLMRYIVDSEKEWIKERKKFLKIDRYPLGQLLSDEIGAPMISPNLYEELILPYEVELSEFQGGIEYWHSCNNTTPFYKLIKQIPNLKMMHISPWSDDKKAVEVFKGEVALDRCLDPVRDLFCATKEEMKRRIIKIISDFGNIPRYFINLNALMKVHNLEYDLNKIKEFLDVYCKIVEKK